jgi:hypothetical protein
MTRSPSSRIIKPTPKAQLKKTSTATNSKGGCAQSPGKGKKRVIDNAEVRNEGNDDGEDPDVEERGVETQKYRKKRKASIGGDTTGSSRKKGKHVGKQKVAIENVDDEEVEVEEPEVVDLDDDKEELEEEVSTASIERDRDTN